MKLFFDDLCYHQPPVSFGNVFKFPIAFLIVNIYIVFSCISISEKGLPKYIYYLSLSNYGMGFKQNLGKVNSLYTDDLNIHYSIFILLVLEVAILIASALKVKKMDVI